MRRSIAHVTREPSSKRHHFYGDKSYDALKKHEPEFFGEVFDGCEWIDVLGDDRLPFVKANSKFERRFAIVGTPFVAYAEKRNLASRESSVKSQNALSKVLAGVGLRDEEVKHESFSIRMHPA